MLEELRQAETEQDFIDIRNELREAGYLRQMKMKKEPKRPSSGPREFRSSTGLRILVGRNNRQNDKLTLKEANRWDLWLHTQKIHGSHVILCTGGAEPDSRSVEEAAMLAAWYSQASAGANVPVDYTPGAPCEKARRRPAGHGDLRPLPDDFRHTGRGAGEGPAGQVRGHRKEKGGRPAASPFFFDTPVESGVGGVALLPLPEEQGDAPQAGNAH